MKQVADAVGVSHRALFSAFAPVTSNDSRVVNSAAEAVREAIGDKNVLPLGSTWPYNTEDFSLHLQHVPGAYFFLGGAFPEEGIWTAPHSPDFDVDEECLVAGVKAMASAVVGVLARQSCVQGGRIRPVDCPLLNRKEGRREILAQWTSDLAFDRVLSGYHTYHT